jgi:hypothetical protein
VSEVRRPGAGEGVFDMGNEDSVRLHAKPGNVRAGVICCGSCAVGGLLLALTGEDVCVMSGLMIAVCFGGVAFLCAMSPGPGVIYLDLTPEGLHEKSPRGGRTLQWGDVDDFEVVNDSEGGPEVAFRVSDAYRGKRARKRFGFGRRFDGLLYDTYGMPAQDLAELLNTWRRRHGPKPSAVINLIDDLL